MAGKRLRRLDLLLPEEHPIFQYQKGERSKVARDWLDIGSKLSEIKESVLEIKEMLAGQPAEKKTDSGFDAAAFSKKIEDMFG